MLNLVFSAPIEYDNCAFLSQQLRQPHINVFKRYEHLTENLHEAESNEEVKIPAEQSKPDCGICGFSVGPA